METVPIATQEHILNFMFPAVLAVCAMTSAHIRELGIGVRPSDLAARGEVIAEDCHTLAGYPQEISAIFRTMLLKSLGETMGSVLEGDDFSPAFCDALLEMFVYFAQSDPKTKHALQLMQYCPAHGETKEFSSIVFHLFMTAYRQVHARYADAHGSIPDSTLMEILS